MIALKILATLIPIWLLAVGISLLFEFSMGYEMDRYDVIENIKRSSAIAGLWMLVFGGLIGMFILFVNLWLV